MGLTKTDDERSTALDAALTATRRDDLQHGTNAAYVRGCVCGECREHQRNRMAGHLESHSSKTLRYGTALLLRTRNRLLIVRLVCVEGLMASPEAS
jgi:hypothetical protein